MDFAVQIFQIIFYGIGSLFMITFLIIGIWSFIIFYKYYKTKRIENYLLNNIHQAINQLSYNQNNTDNTNSEDNIISMNDLLDEED